MGGDDEVVAVNEEVAHGGVGQVVLEQPPVVAVVESTESSTSLCRRAWSGVLGAPLPCFAVVRTLERALLFQMFSELIRCNGFQR
jgi:hypothetical protein